MTIDEAIEIKEKYIQKEYNRWLPPEFREADNLSIEALKRYKIIRACFSELREDRLPGETE